MVVKQAITDSLGVAPGIQSSGDLVVRWLQQRKRLVQQLRQYDFALACAGQY